MGKWKKGGGNMFDDVRRYLSDTIDAVTTKRYDDLQQIAEFATAAKAMRISRIVRTLNYGGRVSETLVYKDTEIFPLYNKKYDRENASCSYTYEFYTDVDFTTLSAEQEQLFEHITNILAILCTCTLNIHVEKLIDHIDRDSGIPNSKGFRAFIEEVKENGILADYAVIRANIKGCNTLNTIFGYQATTEIITKYSKALNKMMYSDEICSRSGSDNFCLMVKKSHLKNHLKSFAKIPVNFFYGKEKTVYEISLRAGIVELDGSTDDIDTILARAETCIDVAKRRTDTDYVYYDLDTITKEQQLTLLESDMPQALAYGEFIVYYQPKVRIDTRTLVGAEALIRWNRDGRVISPADFIPIAERTGLIMKLDMFVLEHTCAMIKQWQESGKRIVPVSVNFSKIHLRFPHLAEKIMNVINRYGIEPHFLEVEFTETAYTDDFNAIKQAIIDLKSYGLMVSMDDFGTGYSSLALLKDLDFDILKLDKSLAGSNDDTRGQVVLENVLHMAKELSMTTVCEGVEDKTIVENLKDMGCNIIQGYYFDKPLPESEFASRLESPVYEK